MKWICTENSSRQMDTKIYVTFVLTREINNDLYLQNKNLLDQEKVLQKQAECLTSLLWASLGDQELIKQSLEKQEHEIRILSLVNEMNLYRKLMTTDGHKDICTVSYGKYF